MKQFRIRLNLEFSLEEVKEVIRMILAEGLMPNEVRIKGRLKSMIEEFESPILKTVLNLEKEKNASNPDLIEIDDELLMEYYFKYFKEEEKEEE